MLFTGCHCMESCANPFIYFCRCIPAEDIFLAPFRLFNPTDMFSMCIGTFPNVQVKGPSQT